MSPPLSEFSLDQQYPSDGYDSQYYDPYAPVPSSGFYTSENFYMYQDVDGLYHWADGPATRSDGCMEYSFLYHPPTLASEAISASAYSPYQHAHFDESPQPPAVHDHSYIFNPAQPYTSSSGRSQVQNHRSSIARASDNFLAQASSIFSDDPPRRSSTLDYRSSVPRQSPQRDSRTPSRKRSRDSLDEGGYHVKGKDDDAHPSLPAPNDACRLPQPQAMVPQGLPPSSVRIPHFDAPGSSRAESHARGVESRMRQEERCTNPLPKYASNKRVHRASEELVRQENTILSMPPTWPIPDDQVVKGTKKPEQKKQALACLFCRERKIACGRPTAHNPDQTCNQCARRRIKCEYPTESRRGQHKRRRKPVEGESAGQSALHSNSTSSVGSTTTTTAPSSTALMTTTASA